MKKVRMIIAVAAVTLGMAGAVSHGIDSAMYYGGPHGGQVAMYYGGAGK